MITMSIKPELTPDKNAKQRKKHKHNKKQTTAQTISKWVRNLRMHHRNKPANGDSKIFYKSKLQRNFLK